MYNAPSLFVNHGGGPLPVLGAESNKEIGEFLRNVSQYVDFDRVEAVILVTAHREEEKVTVTSGARPGMVYDYNNFPAVSYTWSHAAPGAPLLARRVHAALSRAGVQAELDDQRGWDHGVFIPMMLADPAATIPIVQVSVLKNQNASQHFELGRALRQFRERGVAIIGSGMSYHNMPEFKRAEVDNDGVVVNEVFDKYLTEVCTGDDPRKIVWWEGARGARAAHPAGETEHLMPLVVAAGAGGPAPGGRCSTPFFSENLD